MKDILDKLTSYNLFNYLLPGVLFSILITKISEYNLIQEDIIIGAFQYYFTGLVVSRFGSLVIEPILQKTKFVQFADYKDFVSASKNDPKIDTLSESNNMYRTFIALFALTLIFKVSSLISIKFNWSQTIDLTVISLILLIMFLLAYRKQTKYITKRIKANSK